MDVSWKETQRGDLRRQVTVNGPGEALSIPGLIHEHTAKLVAVVETVAAHGRDGGNYLEQVTPALDLSVMIRSDSPAMTRGNWEAFKKLADAAFDEYERRWPK